MAQKKFYAVKSGKKTGIYTTWDECEQNVKGVKGAAKIKNLICNSKSIKEIFDILEQFKGELYGE